jgi:flavin-dependent dehydrogenase
MGLKTVIIERKRIPRHKACSGILIPHSVDTIKEHFQNIPDSVMASPPYIHAMRMHFPNGQAWDMPINGLVVWRDRLDAWLCDASGAEVLDGTALRSFSENEYAVDLLCVQSNDERIAVRSKIMIAADGGSSGIVRMLSPDTVSQLPWFFALQETYECRCNVEPGYFHFYCFPDISLYSSAYVKDGFLLMDVVVKAGDNPARAMSRFRDFLWKETNVRDENRLRRLGCKVTYAATKGLFCFGTDRILVCGEASGLLNQFGEGISSALASGIIAGKASVRAIKENVLPGRIFQRDVEKERRKTVATFDYKKLFFQGRGAFNFKQGISVLPWKDRILFIRNLAAWVWRLKR